MIKIYNWLLKRKYNDILIKNMSEQLNIKNFITKTIFNRGLHDLNTIMNFLNPDVNNLYNPHLLTGVDKAIEIINNHIKLGDKITIYGDYDVDGITSTSILFIILKKLGADVNYYIPDRLSEGYGINLEAIHKIINTNSKLLITVDCGITSYNEVLEARKNGLDVIVTDHHQPPNVIPMASCVINPHLKDCTYPFKNLSGVGVVFKLCQALTNEALEYLDLVSVGTVADIVPLLDENRILVKEGLKKLNHTSNIGLKELIKISGLDKIKISAHHIGFVLAPRLNAAGRLKNALSCVKLLTTDNIDEARKISEYLNTENAIRQQIEKNILNEAIEQIENNVDLKREKIIVLHSDKWHPGVIGIVSSKITEKYSRPSILISVEKGIGRGSCRSIDRFDLYESLKHVKKYLIQFGGHKMAAGLTIKEENIELFRNEINEYANTIISDVDLIPTFKIDAEIQNEIIDIESAKQIEELAPFGNGNTIPLYLFKNLVIKNVSLIGNNHLKMIATKNRNLYEILGFNMGSKFNKFKIHSVIDVVGYIEINTWNNKEKVQINAKDIRIKERNNEYFRYLINILETTNPIDSYSECISKSNIIDMREYSNKKLYVLNTFNKSKNAIVILNTRNQFFDLVRYLRKNNFNNFKINFSKSFYPKEIICGFDDYNYILRYDNILFYDIPFDSKLFFNIILNSNLNTKIYFLFNKNDLTQNIEELNKILPKRNDLIKVYKSIDKNGKTILPDDYLYEWLNLNSIKVKIILKILEETGLININKSDNIFVLSKNVVNKKVNLSENEMIKQIYFGKKEFLKFAKILLSKDIKEVFE